VHLAANRCVEHPQRNCDTAMPVPRFQPAMGNHPPVIHSRQMNPDAAAKPRVPGVENFSEFGTVGVRLMACTIRDARIRDAGASASRRCRRSRTRAAFHRRSRSRPDSDDFIQHGDTNRHTKSW
jgi:hypothetical protein